nr:hypothetical protein [Brachybacterium sp. Z12]
MYASSYLKCHYPAAFTAALLRSQPMGFYSPQSLVADARRHGVLTRGPDVLRSRSRTDLETDEDHIGYRVDPPREQIQGRPRRPGPRSGWAWTRCAASARRPPSRSWLSGSGAGRSPPSRIWPDGCG